MQPMSKVELMQHMQTIKQRLLAVTEMCHVLDELTTRILGNVAVLEQEIMRHSVAESLRILHEIDKQPGMRMTDDEIVEAFPEIKWRTETTGGEGETE